MVPFHRLFGDHREGRASRESMRKRKPVDSRERDNFCKEQKREGSSDRVSGVTRLSAVQIAISTHVSRLQCVNYTK